MMHIWEIPLAVMDASLFDYQKLEIQQAKIVLRKMIDQVKMYNGIFVVLWHNSYLDEQLYTGITKFYIRILIYLIRNNGLALLPKSVIEQFTHEDN